MGRAHVSYNKGDKRNTDDQAGVKSCHACIADVHLQEKQKKKKFKHVLAHTEITA